jgi:pyrimidine operon attenuation protein/uracil phosphoribosyltransferase
MAQNKTQILNHKQVNQILTRMAYEVYERNFNQKQLLFAAINGRGETIAKMLIDKLHEICKIKTAYTTVIIDKENPLNKLSLAGKTIKLNRQTVILVDDVLNTGRTLIYGMLPFLNAGVNGLQTLVLVNRNHNGFPVKADYVGIELSTTLQEHVLVVVERKKVNVYLD